MLLSHNALHKVNKGAAHNCKNNKLHTVVRHKGLRKTEKLQNVKVC